MQSMQINKPFYKSEIPSDMTYQEAVKAAKDSWKNIQAATKEAKRQEREAKKQYDEVYLRHFTACLGEACYPPEAMMEKIAEAESLINHKTGLPYSSFQVKVGFKNDLLEEVNGEEIYKSKILNSDDFRKKVKKYYRNFDLGGVRFTFPEGKPILVMTVFLERKEKQEMPKKEEKHVATRKPNNAYAMLENVEEAEPAFVPTVVEAVVEAVVVPKPMNLKGVWVKK